MRVSRLITAMLLVGGLATPSWAADEAKPGLTTLSKASQTILAASTRESRLRANQQTTAPTESKQFFHSKKGATVVALLAAGFAYTLYSRFHDELKSPIREQ